MEAIEILAIDAEQYRFKANNALIMLRTAEESGDADMIAMGQALYDKAADAYEPYRLHVEHGFAKRNAAAKADALAELEALPDPDTAEGREERRLHLQYAREQVAAADGAVTELEEQIAAHPVASTLARSEDEVNILSPSG